MKFEPAWTAPFVALAVIASAMFTAGCARTATSADARTSPAARAPSIKTAGADALRGKVLFGTHCAACHGASGIEGGVGPSLKAERLRKTSAQAIAWIKNPQPPMPKLYPLPLTEKDVADVTAYVESL